MSKLEVCDLCKKPIMERWEDSAYRITIKEMLHFYDGFQPWRGKRRVDICKPCVQKLVKKVQKLMPTPVEEKE